MPIERQSDTTRMTLALQPAAVQCVARARSCITLCFAMLHEQATMHRATAAGIRWDQTAAVPVDSWPIKDTNKVHGRCTETDVYTLHIPTWKPIRLTAGDESSAAASARGSRCGAAAARCCCCSSTSRPSSCCAALHLRRSSGRGLCSSSSLYLGAGSTRGALQQAGRSVRVSSPP